MAQAEEATIIKKYANRRLYNTGTSTYVTLEDLAEMLKNGEEFVVQDAKTGEDITRLILTQIIFDMENKGPNLLPVAFLRQLIRFYGDNMQSLVPTYLDFTMDALAREQEKLRSQMMNAFGSGTLDAMHDTVRRNTEMFEQAMRMFLPFGAPSERQEPPSATPPRTSSGEKDIDALKKQLDEIQARLDRLSDPKKS